MRRVPSADAMRALLLALAVVAAGCLSEPPAQPGGADDADAPLPDVTYDALRLETDKGAIVAILYVQDAPQTVEFIERLVGEGYYDGREFNRVIPGFVIQEVDRLGGATDQTETIPLEADTRVHFSMGAFGIARNADPDSGGSEFFVMDFAHAHLYRNYTAFAQVVEGMDVVHAIARVPTVATGPASQAPLPPPVGVHDRVAVQPPKILKATITQVTLPGREAAQYPRIVGERTVVEDPPTRYTPEWPADLRRGGAAQMTWFVYTAPESGAPALADAKARVVAPDGTATEAAFTPDPADARILHWTWTPAQSGNHTLELLRGGEAVARAAAPVA